MRAIAIDFETANERRSSPCAVGVAWIEGGEITRRAYTLIRPPEMRFSPWNMRVHGITPDDVRGAPDFAEAMAPFLDDLASHTLLAHNAGFDVAVLRATAAVYGLVLPRLSYLCTRAAARAAWPAERSAGLASVASRLGIAFRHHHAGDDADTCAKVAIAAAASVGTREIGVMGIRLGLRRGVLDGRESVACRPITTEPRRPAPPRPASPLVFTVAGSGGSAYEVSGSFTRRGYALRCGCRAGLFNRRCRHVESLLDGEVSGLLSDNCHDLEKLRVIVQALGEAAVEPPSRPVSVAA